MRAEDEQVGPLLLRELHQAAGRRGGGPRDARAAHALGHLGEPGGEDVAVVMARASVRQPEPAAGVDAREQQLPLGVLDQALREGQRVVRGRGPVEADDGPAEDGHPEVLIAQLGASSSSAWSRA